MKSKKINVDYLCENVEKHLRDKIGLSKKTIRLHRSCFRKLKCYMVENNSTMYSKELGKQFLLDTFKNKPFVERSYVDNRLTSSISYLDHFLQSGYLVRPHCMKTEFTINSPQFQKLVVEFTEFKRNIHKIKSYPLYELNTKIFLSYLESHGVDNVQDITLLRILEYLKDIRLSSSRIDVLKGFLKFLNDNLYVTTDYSKQIPRYKAPKRINPPSHFSKEELKKFIDSIDRGTPMGRRKYAMIIIALRLGMRAADIVALKFENIDWNKNKINYIQTKTEKPNSLPLLPDVGNAILDYIQFGRPKSDEPYIFIHHVPPFSMMRSSVLTNTVQYHWQISGVNIGNRSHGSHSLRHSLAYHMLNNNYGLHVIGSTLGHSTYETTKSYLRIDMSSLSKCSLEVPPLNHDYYGNKNSFFYE